MEKPDFFHRPIGLYVMYGLLAFVLALFVIPTWGWTYWDFGDGNYLYIARRIREGLVLYRDILAPQPPVHTLAGMIAQSIGEAIFGSALIGVRAFCLLLRILAGFLLTLLASRFFRCPFQALAVGAVYLTMPIGFWWSLGYQSENLEIVFLLAAILAINTWEKRGVLIAGVFSALACHTNMTGAPFLIANALFLIFRRKELALWYLASALGVYTLVALIANVMTDGAFVSNVLLNQVGTFPDTNILRFSNPDDSFWKYAVRKVTSESGKVIDLEGGLLAASFIGSAMALKKFAPSTTPGPERDQWHRAEFLSWQLVAGLLSICFTAKGGTVNYIFVLGEPAVALFAGSALALMFRALLPSTLDGWKELSLWNTRPFLLLILPLMVSVIIYRPISENISLTMDQLQSEIPEERVLEVKTFIETYTEPGDLILAPPFYAFLTDTIVAAELAENYIWHIKWKNESFYNKPDDAFEKMTELIGLIERKEIKLILLDTTLTGNVAAIRQAINRHYILAQEQPLLTRNTRLELYVPLGTEIIHDPL